MQFENLSAGRGAAEDNHSGPHSFPGDLKVIAEGRSEFVGGPAL